MDLILSGYSVNGATWFYLSFFLIVAIYFRFNRLFSLRNLDLFLLISASPGLLLLREDVVGIGNTEMQTVGHVWLFVITCLFLGRLFADPWLTRRPYLGQNLNPSGLGFLCISTLVFLMAQGVSETLPEATHDTVQRADELVNRTATDPPDEADEVAAGPAALLFAVPVGLVFEDLAAVTLAILGHVLVVSGLWFVGRNLFGDRNLGLAMATLYLLLPCTAYNVGEFNHVLPAALIIWGFVAHKKPVISGVLLGLACGTMFFPVALLPIWMAYYGRRGAGRFAFSLTCVTLALLASLAFTSADPDSFYQKTIGTINIVVNAITDQKALGGFWQDATYFSPYRIPIMTAYAIMVVVMTIWPRKRSLEVLMAQSAAVIVGTQLWYTQKGGVYLLWYFPLMLMVVFRPRLLRFAFDDQSGESDISRARNAGQSTATSNSVASRIQLFR